MRETGIKGQTSANRLHNLKTLNIPYMCGVAEIQGSCRPNTDHR